MNIAQAFLPVSATGEVPGPTQCVLIVSGQAVVVARADKEEFIKKAVAEGKFVAHPEQSTIEFIAR